MQWVGGCSATSDFLGIIDSRFRELFSEYEYAGNGFIRYSPKRVFLSLWLLFFQYMRVCLQPTVRNLWVAFQCQHV